MYQCSECGQNVGVFLGKDGKPELFICPRTYRPAHTIPKFRPPRKSPSKPKFLEEPDLSQRAKKRERKQASIPGDPWSRSNES